LPPRVTLRRPLKPEGGKALLAAALIDLLGFVSTILGILDIPLDVPIGILQAIFVWYVENKFGEGISWASVPAMLEEFLPPPLDILPICTLVAVRRAFQSPVTRGGGSESA